MDFKEIGSTTIYHGRVFDVRQEQLRLPTGRVVQLDIVAHPGAVVLVPVDNEGNLLFVRQYRHAAGKLILELPAGTTETGEDLVSCAHRELREETGMAAGSLKKIGEFYIAPGYSTEYLYIYLANNLHPAPLPGDDDEFIQIERIPVDQAFTLAEQGSIIDAKTLAALLLARQHLK
jgi:ADP-ribose pyrophosphatase